MTIGSNSASAETRKLRALAVHEARHGAELVRARRALLFRLLEAGTATIEDVRSALPEQTGRPTWLGAVPKELQLLGIIRRAGFAITNRPLSHGRPVSQWELVSRDAALHWLSEHGGVVVQQSLF